MVLEAGVDRAGEDADVGLGRARRPRAARRASRAAPRRRRRRTRAARPRAASMPGVARRVEAARARRARRSARRGARRPPRVAASGPSSTTSSSAPAAAACGAIEASATSRYPARARVGTMMVAVGSIPPMSLGLHGSRDPLPAQPLPHDRRRGARRRRPAVARARAPRRGGRAAGARQRRRSAARARRPGCCAAGCDPSEVADAVRRTGARIVHAHNLNPSLGWRALAAAREAGARTVLHLHNYRLVCAVGTCFTRGADCTRCHGRDTRPGVRLNCRGTRRRGGGLRRRRWRSGSAGCSRTPTRSSCPSAFAGARLRELGAPLDPARLHVVGHVVREVAERSTAADGRARARRLAAGAGEGRRRRDRGLRGGRASRSSSPATARCARELRARAAGTGTRFAGRVGDDELAALRAAAGLAVVPSRSAETFGLAAAEAMAAGPAGRRQRDRRAAGARAGPAGSSRPATPRRWRSRSARASATRAAGEAGRRRVLEVASPAAVGAALRAVYDRRRG